MKMNRIMVLESNLLPVYTSINTYMEKKKKREELKARKDFLKQMGLK